MRLAAVKFPSAGLAEGLQIEQVRNYLIYFICIQTLNFDLEQKQN